MANQAIALQARAPQGNFLAPAIQQGAQFINMMRQQQALDRQTAVAQQSMEIQRAAEAREAAKAGREKQTFELDLPGKIYEKHRAFGSVAAEGGAPAYAQWLEAYRQDDPKVAAAIQQAMPVDKFDPDRFTRMLATMDQRFEARYGKAIIKEFIGQDGTLMSGNLSGLPNASYAVRVPDITSAQKSPPPAAAPTAPPPPAAAPTAPPPPAPSAAPAAGGMFQPISATGGQQRGEDPATVALAASLTKAQETKQIDAGTVEQIKSRIQPELVDRFIQTYGIQVSPGGGMRSAVYRPEGGAPMAQQVQYNPNDFPTARVKSPMQSPAPGIYSVPTPQIAGAAGAQERGTQGVRVVTEPVIAGGKKKAELQAEKEIAFPDAQGQFETALATIDNRLADIKRFREHPARDRVIGPLDAFTPNFGRARGAQAIYDALVATATLDELQQMRKASPTGGALGNVSDADIRILRQSIGAMGQDQPEEDFNESLGIFETRLKQTRDQLIRRYRENYGYKLGKSWNPPTPTARAPTAGKRSSGGFTVMEVQD